MDGVGTCKEMKRKYGFFSWRFSSGECTKEIAVIYAFAPQCGSRSTAS